MISPLRILLAEDNPVNQKVTSLVLKRIGYKCQIVSNGQEAIDALESAPFDVVLMDLSMPVVSGLEAAAIIFTRHARPPTLVALTAHSLGDEMEKCENAGFKDYLTKPIDPVTLKKLLDSIASSS